MLLLYVRSASVKNKTKQNYNDKRCFHCCDKPVVWEVGFYFQMLKLTRHARFRLLLEYFLCPSSHLLTHDRQVRVRYDFSPPAILVCGKFGQVIQNMSTEAPDEVGKACGDTRRPGVNPDTSCHSPHIPELGSTLRGKCCSRPCQMCRELPGTHTLTRSQLCRTYAFSQE